MPLEAFEIFGWFADALRGWRYLFSPSFRRRTHERWKKEGRGKAAIEILFGGLAVFFTLLLLWVLIKVLRG